jgi:pyruvate/2-oxoglutarate dehydrogenase complex dihydrolipoamide dehydrogenase (E3) component
VVVGIARYDDLLRPVAEGRPDGSCQLIADRRTRTILGARVLGEYSAETVQTVAACMAAQKICRTLGIGSFPQVWSYLGAED